MTWLGIAPQGQVPTSTAVDSIASQGQSLVERRILYGTHGQVTDDGVVLSISTMMNCVGLMSNLYKFDDAWDVANFGDNTMFGLSYKTDSSQANLLASLQNNLDPADLLAIIGNDANGETNNHVVSYLGAGGPQSGVKNQILESTAYKNVGVRFSSLEQLLSYYNSTGNPYSVNIYRPKK